MQVETTEKTVSPAERLVSQFYAEWLQEPEMRPGKGDIDLATKLIEDHGESKADGVVKAAIPMLRTNWPEAKTFLAIERYVPDALRAVSITERRDARREEQAAKQAEDRKREAEEKREQEALEERWKALDETERKAIEEAVLKERPEIGRWGKSILHAMCLAHLKRHDQENAR
jgi:hypothetical protein